LVNPTTPSSSVRSLLDEIVLVWFSNLLWTGTNLYFVYTQY